MQESSGSMEASHAPPIVGVQEVEASNKRGSRDTRCALKPSNMGRHSIFPSADVTDLLFKCAASLPVMCTSSSNQVLLLHHPEDCSEDQLIAASQCPTKID